MLKLEEKLHGVGTDRSKAFPGLDCLVRSGGLTRPCPHRKETIGSGNHMDWSTSLYSVFSKIYIYKYCKLTPVFSRSNLFDFLPLTLVNGLKVNST